MVYADVPQVRQMQIVECLVGDDIGMTEVC